MNSNNTQPIAARPLRNVDLCRQVSALRCLLQPTAAPIFQPIGGMDQFPKGLARAIGAHGIFTDATTTISASRIFTVLK